MPNYLARVELHDVEEEEDYELLHTAMEQRGLLRQIQGDDGVPYELPNATYVMQNTDINLPPRNILLKLPPEKPNSSTASSWWNSTTRCGRTWNL